MARIRMRRVVVVGGSLAGHHVAQALRDRGYDGDLTVYGAERRRPYERYPLSKAFLAGEIDEDALAIEPRGLDVDWRLGQTATGLDLAGRTVTIDGIERVAFDGLVIATGSRPRIPCPLRPGTEGVFVLRTVEDGRALRAALGGERRRLVVVGGGLIGVEVASAAAGRHDTTLVDSSPLPTARSLGTPVARHLRALHLESGVRLVPDARVTALDVHGGRVRGVLLDTDQRLATDVVVLATGTQPNVEWLSGTGLHVSNGLRCRATLHVDGSDVVVGAGDVVSAPHPALDGEPVRVEHWASTRHQAGLAAANLVVGPSQSEPQRDLPTFGTTVHGVAVRAIGFPSMADTGDVVWGSLHSGEAVVALSRRGRVIAVVAVNAAHRLTLLHHRWPRTLTEVTRLLRR